MNNIFPIILYIIITFTVLQNWLLTAAIATLMFSLRYGSITLIPLAILIDGYFGNFFTIPALSIGSILWFVVVDFLRPRFINFQAN